jgi:hypothetical protein
MQEAAAVRRAALDAVGDVSPAPLRERLEARIDDGSMAPGVLTVLSARAVDGATTGEEMASDSDASGGDGVEATVTSEAGTTGVERRGAGVQLIYEGLRLTRTLAQDEPWIGPDDATTPDTSVATNGGSDAVESSVDRDSDDADMAILVADVLVARGFYLLARTEAAAAAVRVVQSFGADQTTRRETGDSDLDRNLEADVFELAAVAGTTAVGSRPTPALRDHVATLARTNGHLPLSDRLFTDSTVDTLAGFVADDRAGDVATSADH